MPNYDTRVYAGHALGSVSGTTSSLPAGFVLGEERWQDGIKYRLAYNAGNSAINPGYVGSPVPLNGGAYSITITTASKTYCNFGAVAVHNATVPTGSYFWGAVRGYLASGLVADAVTLATGSAFYVGVNGQVNGITANSTPVSANINIGVSVNGPTAGTIAVRQGSVILAIE